MSRPTLEDLQNVWLYTYSRASLIEAVEFLEAMGHAKPNSVELHALINAAFAAYARPFSQCKVPPGRRVVPLENVSPPPRLAEFHQDALNARHTMVGHKDATPAEGYTATPNVALVEITSRNFALNTTKFGEMEAPMKEALKKLCGYFVTHCEQQLRLWKEAYRSEVMKIRPGVYELVISEPPSDWIVPFRPKRGVDFRAIISAGAKKFRRHTPED